LRGAQISQILDKNRDSIFAGKNIKIVSLFYLRERGEGFKFGVAERDCEAFSYCGGEIK